MKLVLASKSPRRKELLSLCSKEFDVRVSDADESYDPSLDPKDIARIIATKKAMATELLQDDEIIIGCDTIVVSPSGEIMGKPRDKSDAVRMLKALSGTAHKVISGLCVHSKDKVFATSITTTVYMRTLCDEEIEYYVSTYNPIDKAGAYGIQEMAGSFVEKIDGDFFNVVGLPLCDLSKILKEEFDFPITY
jgi:septum formation protein